MSAGTAGSPAAASNGRAARAGFAALGIVLGLGLSLRLVDIGRPELRIAAQLRALHTSIRTPDALQLAAGPSAGCTSFVTNDRDLPPVKGLKVVQLRNYVR